MPDPFEALRTAPTPIDPDPAFAARLRARVLRAVMTTQGDLDVTFQQATATGERLRQGDLSYFSLWVRDVPRAVTFFGSVLGWRFSGPADRLVIEGQAISQGIGDLRGSTEYMRQMGVPLPEISEPTAYPVFVTDDIDATVQRVRAAGGWASEPFRQPYGSIASCLDNQGMLFSLNQVPAGAPVVRPPASGNRQGDIAYLVFETPDSARAREFFGTVLGLTFTQGRTPDGWNIDGMVPMAGLAGGRPRPTVVPMYRVGDIQAAVERVRDAGGTATDPVVAPYGKRAECVDDQGLRFLLGEF
jgi:predicted enzyme related to lactoylglutathione lyase